jgi:hypothetical protein
VLEFVPYPKVLAALLATALPGLAPAIYGMQDTRRTEPSGWHDIT